MKLAYYLPLLFLILCISQIHPLFAMEETALGHAIEQDNAGLVVKLLKKCLNSLPTRPAKRSLLNSLLATAYKADKEQTVMALILNRADPDIIVNETTGGTMLMELVAHPSLFNLLINNGANPFKYNNSGCAALHYCASAKHTKTALDSARMLIERVGVDYPARRTKRSLLSFATTQTDRCPLMALALDNHADPNNNQAWQARKIKAPLTYALLAIDKPGKYEQECPFKTALLLYTFGGTTSHCKLKDYFSRQQIALMKQERGRRIADCAFLSTRYSADELRGQPFSQVYNAMQEEQISQALEWLGVLLARARKSSKGPIDLVIDYAAYDPVSDNYARDPEPVAPNRACGGQSCVIQ